MLRANSLKKALRQIIEQAEKGGGSPPPPLAGAALAPHRLTSPSSSGGRAEPAHAVPQDVLHVLHQEGKQRGAEGGGAT